MKSLPRSTMDRESVEITTEQAASVRPLRACVHPGACDHTRTSTSSTS